QAKKLTADMLLLIEAFTSEDARRAMTADLLESIDKTEERMLADEQKSKGQKPAPAAEAEAAEKEKEREQAEPFKFRGALIRGILGSGLLIASVVFMVLTGNILLPALGIVLGVIILAFLAERNPGMALFVLGWGSWATGLFFLLTGGWAVMPVILAAFGLVLLLGGMGRHFSLKKTETERRQQEAEKAGFQAGDEIIPETIVRLNKDLVDYFEFFETPEGRRAMTEASLLNRDIQKQYEPQKVMRNYVLQIMETLQNKLPWFQRLGQYVWYVNPIGRVLADLGLDPHGFVRMTTRYLGHYLKQLLLLLPVTIPVKIYETFLKPFLEILLPKLKDILIKFKDRVILPVVSFFGTVFAFLMEGVTRFLRLPWVGKIVQVVKDVVTAVKDFVVKWAKRIWNRIKKILSGFWEYILVPFFQWLDKIWSKVFRPAVMWVRDRLGMYGKYGADSVSRFKEPISGKFYANMFFLAFFTAISDIVGQVITNAMKEGFAYNPFQTLLAVSLIVSIHYISTFVLEIFAEKSFTQNTMKTLVQMSYGLIPTLLYQVTVLFLVPGLLGPILVEPGFYAILRMLETTFVGMFISYWFNQNVVQKMTDRLKVPVMLVKDFGVAVLRASILMLPKPLTILFKIYIWDTVIWPALQFLHLDPVYIMLKNAVINIYHGIITGLESFVQFLDMPAMHWLYTVLIVVLVWKLLKYFNFFGLKKYARGYWKYISTGVVAVIILSALFNWHMVMAAILGFIVLALLEQLIKGAVRGIKRFITKAAAWFKLLWQRPGLATGSLLLGLIKFIGRVSYLVALGVVLTFWLYGAFAYSNAYIIAGIVAIITTLLSLWSTGRSGMLGKSPWRTLGAMVCVVTGMFFIGAILTSNTFLPGFFAATSGLLILMVLGMFRIFTSAKAMQKIRAEHTDPWIAKRLNKMEEVIPMDDLRWRSKAFGRLFGYAAAVALVFFSALGQIRIPGILYSVPLSMLTPTISIQGPWLVVVLTALLALGVFALIQILRERLQRKASAKELKEKPGFWRRSLTYLIQFGVVVLGVLPLASTIDAHLGSPRSLKIESLQTGLDNAINKYAPIDRKRVSDWFAPREERTTETGTQQGVGGRTTVAEPVLIGPVDRVESHLSGLFPDTKNEIIKKPADAVQNGPYQHLEIPLTPDRIKIKGAADEQGPEGKVIPLAYNPDKKSFTRITLEEAVGQQQNNYYLESNPGDKRARISFAATAGEISKSRFLRFDYNGSYLGKRGWLDIFVKVKTRDGKEQEIFVRPWYTYGYVSVDIQGAILREGIAWDQVEGAEISIMTNHSQAAVFGNLQNLRLASEYTEFWRTAETLNIYDKQQVRAFCEDNGISFNTLIMGFQDLNYGYSEKNPLIREIAKYNFYLRRTSEISRFINDIQVDAAQVQEIMDAVAEQSVLANWTPEVRERRLREKLEKYMAESKQRLNKELQDVWSSFDRWSVAELNRKMRLRWAGIAADGWDSKYFWTFIVPEEHVFRPENFEHEYRKFMTTSPGHGEPRKGRSGELYAGPTMVQYLESASVADPTLPVYEKIKVENPVNLNDFNKSLGLSPGGFENMITMEASFPREAVGLSKWLDRVALRGRLDMNKLRLQKAFNTGRITPVQKARLLENLTLQDVFASEEEILALYDQALMLKKYGAAADMKKEHLRVPELADAFTNRTKMLTMNDEVELLKYFKSKEELLAAYRAGLDLRTLVRQHVLRKYSAMELEARVLNYEWDVMKFYPGDRLQHELASRFAGGGGIIGHSNPQLDMRDRDEEAILLELNYIIEQENEKRAEGEKPMAPLSMIDLERVMREDSGIELIVNADGEIVKSDVYMINTVKNIRERFTLANSSANTVFNVHGWPRYFFSKYWTPQVLYDYIRTRHPAYLYGNTDARVVPVHEMVVENLNLGKTWDQFVATVEPGLETEAVRELAAKYNISPEVLQELLHRGTRGFYNQETEAQIKLRLLKKIRADLRQQGEADFEAKLEAGSLEVEQVILEEAQRLQNQARSKGERLELSAARKQALPAAREQWVRRAWKSQEAQLFEKAKKEAQAKLEQGRGKDLLMAVYLQELGKLERYGVKDAADLLDLMHNAKRMWETGVIEEDNYKQMVDLLLADRVLVDYGIYTHEDMDRVLEALMFHRQQWFKPEAHYLRSEPVAGGQSPISDELVGMAKMLVGEYQRISTEGTNWKLRFMEWVINTFKETRQMPAVQPILPVELFVAFDNGQLTLQNFFKMVSASAEQEQEALFWRRLENKVQLGRILPAELAEWIKKADIRFEDELGVNFWKTNPELTDEQILKYFSPKVLLHPDITEAWMALDGWTELRAAKYIWQLYYRTRMGEDMSLNNTLFRNFVDYERNNRPAVQSVKPYEVQPFDFSQLSWERVQEDIANGRISIPLAPGEEHYIVDNNQLRIWGMDERGIKITRNDDGSITLLGNSTRQRKVYATGKMVVPTDLYVMAIQVDEITPGSPIFMKIVGDKFQHEGEIEAQVHRQRVQQLLKELQAKANTPREKREAIDMAYLIADQEAMQRRLDHDRTVSTRPADKIERPLASLDIPQAGTYFIVLPKDALREVGGAIRLDIGLVGQWMEGSVTGREDLESKNLRLQTGQSEVVMGVGAKIKGIELLRPDQCPPEIAQMIYMPGVTAPTEYGFINAEAGVDLTMFRTRFPIPSELNAQGIESGLDFETVTDAQGQQWIKMRGNGNQQWRFVYKRPEMKEISTGVQGAFPVRGDPVEGYGQLTNQDGSVIKLVGANAEITKQAAWWQAATPQSIGQLLQKYKNQGANGLRVFVPYEEFGRGKVNPAYLDKLEEVVKQARDRNMIVSISLFHGYTFYSLQTHGSENKAHAQAIVERLSQYPNIIWGLGDRPDQAIKDKPSNTQRVFTHENAIRWYKEMAPFIKAADNNRHAVMIETAGADAVYRLLDPHVLEHVDIITIQADGPETPLGPQIEKIKNFLRDNTLNCALIVADYPAETKTGLFEQTGRIVFTAHDLSGIFISHLETDPTALPAGFPTMAQRYATNLAQVKAQNRTLELYVDNNKAKRYIMFTDNMFTQRLWQSQTTGVEVSLVPAEKKTDQTMLPLNSLEVFNGEHRNIQDATPDRIDSPGILVKGTVKPTTKGAPAPNFGAVRMPGKLTIDLSRENAWLKMSIDQRRGQYFVQIHTPALGTLPLVLESESYGEEINISDFLRQHGLQGQHTVELSFGVMDNHSKNGNLDAQAVFQFKLVKTEALQLSKEKPGHLDPVKVLVPANAGEWIRPVIDEEATKNFKQSEIPGEKEYGTGDIRVRMRELPASIIV
ncbi:cellulase family glycosylhydrolase, partial [candidate division FCPU426 bacterium]|nr:cellulase family glycosylhydrolase [candidate division FCPU426 bacterium]